MTARGYAPSPRPTFAGPARNSHQYYNVSDRPVEVVFGVAPCYRVEAP
jgi:hypothetical protein